MLSFYRSQTDFSFDLHPDKDELYVKVEIANFLSVQTPLPEKRNTCKALKET